MTFTAINTRLYIPSQALMTTVVFTGMMLSSTLWGHLSDRYGRRQALILSSFFLFFYGFISAFSPSLTWIVFLRFMVGVQVMDEPFSNNVTILCT